VKPKNSLFASFCKTMISMQINKFQLFILILTKRYWTLLWRKKQEFLFEFLFFEGAFEVDFFCHNRQASSRLLAYSMVRQGERLSDRLATVVAAMWGSA
jgi:hypothetical protein